MLPSIAIERYSSELSVIRAKGRHRWWWPPLALAAADAAALGLSWGVSALLWAAVGRGFPRISQFEYWMLVVVFLAICAGHGLYRAMGMSDVEELRGLIVSVGQTCAVLAVVAFMTKGSDGYSRGVTALTWCCATVILPSARLALKHVWGSQEWFARPVAIIGTGPAAEAIAQALRKNHRLALRPVLAFDDNPSQEGDLCGVPVVGPVKSAGSYCRVAGIDYGIVAMAGLPQQRILEVIRSTSSSFSRLLLVPDLVGVSSAWVEAKDVGGTLGLEIRDNLLRTTSLVIKRVLDLAVSLFFLPLTLPLCGLVMLAVKIGSPGPAFYSQLRVGRGGEIIRIWKFRTMLPNADKLLQEYLASDINLKTEWARDHKLRNDPRINRLGRFLRRTSLDELPQLWNVMKGDMSLVGPRPIVSAEVAKFGESYDLYTRVPPGITGPWQVSGRNNLSYDERLRLNEYYVRNWSVWLDLLILLKTVRVVLTSDGAC